MKLFSVVKHANYFLAIDLGIDRFATCVTNTGIEPFAIDGRPLKYQNQWYNKEKAYYQERLRNGLAPNKGNWISKQLQSLDSLRNSRLKDYYHQATAHIINVAVEEKISLILIGQNTGWKQNVKLRKRTKQNFAFLSHEMFISLMTYKANEKGIEVRVVEESYTSKASFLDCDDIPIFDKENKKKHRFSGKRLGRGLYRSKDGIILQTDVNGACNILRKHGDPDFFADYKGLSRLNIWRRDKKIVPHKHAEHIFCKVSSVA